MESQGSLEVGGRRVRVRQKVNDDGSRGKERKT